MQNSKYLLPVELDEKFISKTFNIKLYEYKLYSDYSEEKFSKIRFIDLNGFIIGNHMPTKLNTLYDKATFQVKQATAKTVLEIRQAMDGVADIAVAAATGVKQDVTKTTKTATNVAVNLYDSVKNRFKKKNEKIEEPK